MREPQCFDGIAEGQVRNPQALARLPPFQVAIYSLLLLASLLAYGFPRTTAYLPLPNWRRPLSDVFSVPALSRGERVARCRRFHQPERAGPSPAEGLWTRRAHSPLRPAGG
jgi:hypothetical protein